MRPPIEPARSAPRITYTNSAPKPVVRPPASLAAAPAPSQIGQPAVPPLADQFVPPPGPTDMDRVNAAKVWLQRNRDAKLTADAIMVCLTPAFAASGPIEAQIQALLMQILAKMDGAKRRDGFEAARMEELKKALRSKEALTELKKIERSLDNERRAHSQEQDKGMEAVSAVTRAQNEMFMNSLRDMRA